MAENRGNIANPHVGPPPPSSTTSSTIQPFTPRSSTFPDDVDSDPDFDVFEPTPTNSPGGPRYDDLPPSYDEAQQQALQDARDGRPPLDPNDFEIHRMVLNDDHPAQAQQNIASSRSQASLLNDPNAYEFEPENRRNASGLGLNVPIQQVESNNSAQIPVGRIPFGSAPSVTSPGSAPPLDQTSALLSRALEFTQYEPAADAQYAPRLTRAVAIPQVSITDDSIQGQSQKKTGKRSRKEECRKAHERQRLQKSQQVPGQWPDSGSTDTVDAQIDGTAESVQFLRAYAKSLHAHDIRPAEFAEFLDGLNALCFAAGTTPQEVANSQSSSDGPSSIVNNYIQSANEAFFAPRGLRVSIKSLSTFVDALNIPEERGQRAAAIATAIDGKAGAAQRAQALHPYIEALETNVPAPSTQAMYLREMSANLRRQSQPTTRGTDSSNSNNNNALHDPEKARLAQEDSDPPLSVPDEHQPSSSSAQNQRAPFPGMPPMPPVPGIPLFGGRRHGGGRGGFCPPPGPGPFGRGPRGPGWGGPGPHFPWGPPPGHQGPPWSRGPHHNHPWGFGAHGHSQNRGNANQYQNEWAAWGNSMGKWGEELGKRVGAWGEQLGRSAGQWGDDVGRQAADFAEEVGRSVSNVAGPSARTGSASASTSTTTFSNVGGNGESASMTTGVIGGGVGIDGQESGVHRDINGGIHRDVERGIRLDPSHDMPIPVQQDEKRQPPSTSTSVDTSTNTIPKPTTIPRKPVSQPQPKPTHQDSDDDDDSSDSDSSSDSSDDSEDDESESLPDTEALFLTRVRSINRIAEAATAKGKKTPEEISHERDIAIEKAAQQKTAMDAKIAIKLEKREALKELRRKKKELRAEYRGKWKELRRGGGEEGKGNGNGKIKAKGKDKVWRKERKEVKREFRERKRGLRREREEVRKEFRGRKREGRRSNRGAGGIELGLDETKESKVVWVVVENLS